MFSLVQLAHGVPAAALVTVLLSTLVSFIEVSHRSKTRKLSTIVCAQFWLYWTIVTLGSLVMAGVTAWVTREYVVTYSPWYAMVSAFAGVVLFGLGPRQVNLSYFGADIHISDWIDGARDNAVGAAVQREVEEKALFEQRATAMLRRLPEADLNTYLKANGHADTVSAIENDSTVDRTLYKAMILASDKPAVARAIMKELSRKGKA